MSRKVPSKKVSQWLEKCPYSSTIKLNTTRIRINRTRKGRVLIIDTRCERCSQSTAQRQILRKLDCLADDAEGAECMDQDCYYTRWKCSKYCVSHLLKARQRGNVSTASSPRSRARSNQYAVQSKYTILHHCIHRPDQQARPCPQRGTAPTQDLEPDTSPSHHPIMK